MTTTEFLEATGLVPEPLTELRARRQLPLPLVELGRKLIHLFLPVVIQVAQVFGDRRDGAAIGREIIHAGLVNEEFVRRATTGFEAYAASVEPYTLERAQADTGVPGELIRQLAHEYARADRAQICWTLGITEHHNAADNVFALINLSLLTGHVGRYGSGLVPLRGQNNVQGGGDMGAIPNKLTGFQDVETNTEARARFEATYGAPIPPEKGWHLSLMFEAMERGELTACYIIGENPLRSEADTGRARKLLGGLEHFVVQDMFLTDTAALADVVLPATATWCEAEGTVTNSES